MAKETHSYGNRDPSMWQKKPTHVTKETYSYGKRDAFMWKKKPTHEQTYPTHSIVREHIL